MRAAARIAVISLGLAGALASVPASAKDPETFAIGGIFSMTGPAPHYGEVMSRASELAVEEINAKGGIEGIKLQLFIEDHKSGDVQAAVAGFNRLVSLHDAQVILSSFSGPTVAIAPLSKEKQILVLNGGGVSPKMVGVSPYMFHNRSLASDLAGAIAHRAKERGFSRMAQIAIKDEFGDSTIAATNEAWKKLGREMVATEQFPNDAANIDTQVAKLRASNPDVIADWPTSPQSGMVVKRLREIGMNQPIEAMEWTPDDMKVAGKYAEGVEVVTDYFAPTADNPWGQHFFDAYKAKYNDEPDFYAANYYEAVYIVADVIRRAKAKGGDYWNGAKLAEALRDNPSFDSVYGGKLTFKPNGVALKRVGLLRVENGQLKFQGLIEAE